MIIPPMLVRIFKGHTGRKMMFHAGRKLLIWVMLTAVDAAGGGIQIYAFLYPMWVYLAASSRAMSYALLGIRFVPRFKQPRVDSRAN